MSRHLPKQLRRFRRLLILLTFALQTTIPVAVAVAKKKAAAGPETQETWVIGYVLVLLSMGLGLYVICRAGTRQP